MHEKEKIIQRTFPTTCGIGRDRSKGESLIECVWGGGGGELKATASSAAIGEG